MIIYFVPVVILYCVYILLAKYVRSTFQAQSKVILNQYVKKLMVVTAHPDDEVMFFAPSIFSLVEMYGKENIYLLCFSNGNYYGEGKTREKEMVSCCRQLGISPGNMAILNDERFPDHPAKTWNKNDLCTIIEQCGEKFGADTVLSFDKYGVSGHNNHKDVHQSVVALKQLTRLILSDVSIFRKYSSIFDVFFTVFMNYFSVDSSVLVFLNLPWDVLRSYMAMHCHKSQLTWYRKLYFLYSRYLLVNHVKVYLKGK